METKYYFQALVVLNQEEFWAFVYLSSGEDLSLGDDEVKLSNWQTCRFIEKFLNFLDVDTSLPETYKLNTLLSKGFFDQSKLVFDSNIQVYYPSKHSYYNDLGVVYHAKLLFKRFEGDHFSFKAYFPDHNLAQAFYDSF